MEEIVFPCIEHDSSKCIYSQQEIWNKNLTHYEYHEFIGHYLLSQSGFAHNNEMPALTNEADLTAHQLRLHSRHFPSCLPDNLAHNYKVCCVSAKAFKS